MPFGKVAVLYADESYGLRVEEALLQSGIPVSGPDRAPLANQPEGRFITGLLDIHASKFSRETVMSWLTGSPVVHRGKPVPAARWDSISRSAGITSGLDVWRRRLAEFQRSTRISAARGVETGELEEERAEAQAHLAAEAANLAAFVAGFGEEPPPEGAASWTELVSWLRRMMEAYLAQPQGDVARARRDRVDGICERMAALDALGGPAPGLEHFSRVLQGELEQTAGNVRSLGRGVFVAPVGHAAGCRFRAVHIVGMAEGAFPWTDSPDPLLPDLVRRDVEPSGAALPRREHRQAVARRAYLAALLSADERYLVWPRSIPGERRESGPAQWFVEAAQVVSGNPALQGGDLSGDDSPVRFEPACTEQSDTEAADGHEFDVRSVAAWRRDGRKALDHFLAANADMAPGRGLRAEMGRYAPRLSQWDGDLTARPPLWRLAGTVMSPTRLESWAACPFRYLLAHGLRVEPTERPEEPLELPALEKGSLVHGVLERFVSSRMRLESMPDAAASEALLNFS